MPAGVHHRPGEGETLHNALGNRTAVVKAALPHMTVFEFTVEGPFDGPGPHTHDDHTDSFYILDGELDVYIGGAWTRATPGTYVAAHRIAPCPSRSSAAPVRARCIHGATATGSCASTSPTSA